MRCARRKSRVVLDVGARSGLLKNTSELIRRPGSPGALCHSQTHWQARARHPPLADAPWQERPQERSGARFGKTPGAGTTHTDFIVWQIHWEKQLKPAGAGFPTQAKAHLWCETQAELSANGICKSALRSQTHIPMGKSFRIFLSGPLGLACRETRN